MQELDEIQLTSNTKDARAGRNTNTSILVAADMHATEALNQQWETISNGNRCQIRSNYGYSSRAYRVSSSGTSWRFHLAVYHKTTRLCIALSAHGSTRAKCIRSNGRIQIRSNTKDARTGRNTINIQHKRCKSWTKYKYIHPRSSRYACNRSTESTMGNDIKR
mgnify:CR=1 FL=1